MVVADLKGIAPLGGESLRHAGSHQIKPGAPCLWFGESVALAWASKLRALTRGRADLAPQIVCRGMRGSPRIRGHTIQANGTPQGPQKFNEPTHAS